MEKKEREKLENNYEKYSGEKTKSIKWKRICIETKNQPNEPKSLITGDVSCIYPTGDIAFSKIEKMELWNTEENEVLEVAIPDQYKKAKKIVFRREIIASTIYLEEREE